MEEIASEEIFGLTSVLEEISDYDEILRLITSHLEKLLNSGDASIIMINPRTHSTIKTIYSEQNAHTGSNIKFLHNFITGWVLKHKMSFISNNPENGININNSVNKNSNDRPILCTPLKGGGKITGVIFILGKSKTDAFSQSDLELLEKFSSIVSPYINSSRDVYQYFTPQLSSDSLITKYEELGLMGKCDKFVEMLKSIEIASKCSVRVMIQGKSGTGKELVAKAIHKISSRGDNKFIAIDCGAIPAHLLESELFGFVKGAFTGAERERKGLLEEANGGTFFMDEVTNLPMETQSKLLRVLQENEIRPLGSNETRKIDVRFITASSGSIKDYVENGEFREDLFYRLHVYPIYIPSLQERIEDIPLLSQNFLDRYTKQQNKRIVKFSDDSIASLIENPWKGNIRELENLVERTVATVPDGTEEIGIDYLPEEFSSTSATNINNQKNSLPQLMELYELQLVKEALENAEGNQSEAARQLGIPEQTLRYKMKKLKIKQSISDLS